MFYLYYLENMINGNMYLGKSKEPEKRWDAHKHIAFGETPSYEAIFFYVHAAIKKYGDENFVFNVFSSFESEEESYLAEQDWIAYLKSQGVKLYNLALGGVGTMSGDKHPGFGKPRSPEVRAKISLAKVGKGFGKDNPNFGNTMCAESRARIAAARTGSTASEETKQKISATLLSKTPEERNCVRGENKAGVILTEDQVRRIKHLLIEGKKTFKEIGRMFGVASSTINNIKRGRNWKHVKASLD